VTQYIIGDLRTGRKIQTINVLKGPWSDQLNTAETVSATVDLNDPDMQALRLDVSAEPAKSFLVVEEAGKVMGGPIWTTDWDRDNRTLQLNAKGMASIFDHRLIIPLLAKSLGVDQWTVPDPSDTTKTMPNPALASTYVNLWLGTIAKRFVQEALAWTGGNLPIVFQDDELGTHEDTVNGVDFKLLGDKLKDITKLEGGPDINFIAERTSDQLGFQWLMQTGTAEQPQVAAESITVWSVTAPKSPVSGLHIKKDATKMASIAWEVGGRQADTVLVSRAVDDTLTDAGYPLMEIVDSSHSSVSEQPTLDGYSAELLLQGQSPSEQWSFDVKAYPVDDDGQPAGPQFGSYSKGDYCQLNFDRWNPETGIGDPYRPEKGQYKMRIIGLAGDELADKVTVSVAPRTDM
jgi:hypothetical protein